MKEMKDYSLSTGDICVQQVADFDRFRKMRKLSLGDEIQNFEIFIITFFRKCRRSVNFTFLLKELFTLKKN